MTQDQQGRWRMGVREWIAFVSLLVAIIVHGVSGVVWTAKLEARLVVVERLLERIDGKREDDARLAQRVTDIERRVSSLEQRP